MASNELPPRNKTLSDLLVLIAPYLFLGAGILMLAIATYASGTETLTCKWKNDRLNCIVERFRVMGSYLAERKFVNNVSAAFIRTSTTDNLYVTPAKNRFNVTSSNDALMLRTKFGEDVDTLGGEKSTEFAERVDAMLKDQKETPLILQTTNWPFAYALGGLALVFVAFGAAAIHFSNR